MLWAIFFPQRFGDAAHSDVLHHMRRLNRHAAVRRIIRGPGPLNMCYRCLAQ